MLKVDLKLPANKYHFSAGKLVAKGHRPLRIVLSFQDEKPDDLARRSGLKVLQVKSLLQEGIWQGKRGQIHLTNECVLAGLGRSAVFHPESLGELMRCLGRWQCSLEKVAITVDLNAVFQPPAATRQTVSEEGEDEDEGEESADYKAPAPDAWLVSQAVCCFLIGAEKLDLFKAAGTAKKQHCLQVGVMAPLPVPVLKKAVAHGELLGRMVNGIRRIAELPGNLLSPAELENYAIAIAREFKLKFKAIQAPELKQLGCGGILAVGQGSAVPPRMLLLEYNPGKSKKKPLVLVGKGITFDTGGISLKPPAEMHEMKYDMCGAALALHAIALASATKVKEPVVAALGIAENMPDGKAIKPGDVYRAYNGKTVEIQNTDAEGRLVLADVLAYVADKYKPACMLDFATLTGACVISLGHEAAGLLTASDRLAEILLGSSRLSQDRLWRLPHWKLYGKDLKSSVADMRNIAGRPAGTISAMQFLARHVPSSIPWAHFDIAGTAWRPAASGTQCKGPTGWGLRLLDVFLENYSSSKLFKESSN